jgi:hypothetical protein
MLEMFAARSDERTNHFLLDAGVVIGGPDAPMLAGERGSSHHSLETVTQSGTCVRLLFKRDQDSVEIHFLYPERVLWCRKYPNQPEKVAHVDLPGRLLGWYQTAGFQALSANLTYRKHDLGMRLTPPADGMHLSPLRLSGEH